MTELVDRDAREQIHTALDRNMVVEAAAGTGKTTELVGRIIALLAEGHARVDSLVAVTFTEKAAGELKLRIRAELERARRTAGAGSERRRRLDHALAHLEEARVGTIHGFCADLLRQRSVEAQVDPLFQMLTEAEAERLFAEAFGVWFQQKLEALPEGLRRSLRRVSRAPRFSARPQALAEDAGVIERLRSAAWRLAEWRDFPTPWRRDPFDRAARIDGLVDEVHGFADMTATTATPQKEVVFRRTQAVRKLSAAIRTAESVGARDHDGLEGQLIELGRDRDLQYKVQGRGREYSPGLARNEVLNARQSLRDSLERFTTDADADLAACLFDELREAVERYESLKRRLGRVDFVDLLIRTRDLIRDDDLVRGEFQSRFTHILIDEFQDTDPLQAEILLLLASEDPSVSSWRQATPGAGKLFVVADPKQSIYRFRRADVGMYMEVKDLLERHGALCVELTTSFRSAPAIQRAVNAAFAPVMTGDADSLQAPYVPLMPARDDLGDQPSVVALPVPAPYGYRGVTATAIGESLPDAVGAFVHWLLTDSGWTVTTRDDPERRVPIEARHVCLLFRRLDSRWAGDVTRGYVEALESRGVRHLLVGGKSFHVREEVETVRTALTAVEWPDDELSVFATLRGSLFAIGDEELLEYRQVAHHLHPFRPASNVPTDLEPITGALALLASLHRLRNYRPVSETINQLLEATRAHAGFVLRPSGEQALANVLYVAEQARSYETGGGISFRGFVERLIGDADQGKVAEAPVLEEGSDGVRVMTVHKAKGLEFPVVVLADISAASRGYATRHVDVGRRLCAQKIGGWAPVELHEAAIEEERREQAENMRVAYVAATRARDLLVVPAVGDERFDRTWVQPLNRAIYPERRSWQQAAPAPGCPEFGTDSAVERPADHMMAESVRPGLHHMGGDGLPALTLVGDDRPPIIAAGDDGYDVVWWDPHALELGVRPVYGVRREDLIHKDVDDAVVEADRARFEAWHETHTRTTVRASNPTLTVRTATDAATDDAGSGRTGAGPPADAGSGRTGAGEVEVLSVDVERHRPSGRRFGTLVHAVLAAVSLDADPGEIAEVARLQGRILGSTEAEVEASRDVAVRVLAHPVMARARQAETCGDCRRETPLTLRLDDGSLIDGIVDLAFREGKTWTVVDFKTDQDLGDELRRYTRQVEIYAEAITRATSEESQGVLLKV